MRKLLLAMVVTLLALTACGGGDADNNANENANLDNNTEVNNEENNSGNNNGDDQDAGNVGEVTEIEDLASLDAKTAAEVLEEDADADIFQFEGVVYKTEGELDEDVGVTLKELIGKVTKKVDSDTEFEDGMANELMPNVKIYSTNEEDLTVVLVEVQDEKRVYYAQLNE